MIKIGVVGTSGGWSSETLADRVEQKTGFRLLINLEEVCLDLASGKAWYRGTDLTTLDALIIKKAGTQYSPLLLDRLEILRYLNERGLKMYSKPYNILRVLDRISCTVTLKNGDIPMPETVITEDVDHALATVERFGQAVFKPIFSTKARGMVVMEQGPDTPEKIQTFKENFSIMYIQKMMDIGGKDFGIVFLGGEYLTTYARCSTGESWNTTTRSGGQYKACTPSKETIDLARRAQNLFDLDFTCVDVAETSNGTIVFEVSAFGGFKGVLTATGIDAAQCYVDYVLEKLRN